MKVCFILVTFNPDIARVKSAVKSIAEQADAIFIVDNCSENIEDLLFLRGFPTVYVQQLKSNVGVGAASNIGADAAKKFGADILIFSDQDTTYPPGYRAKVESIFLSNKEELIVAPQFFDVVRQEHGSFLDAYPPYPVLKSFREPLTPVLHAIASGLSVRCVTFDKIKGFNEALFIDWVDFEFCWRARHFGVTVICCRSLVIDHELGDGQKVFLGRKITLRSWHRHYFMVRNEVYLAVFGKYTPRGLRCRMFFRALRRVIVMPLVFPKKFAAYALSGLIAFLHALLGKLGPLVLRK